MAQKYDYLSQLKGRPATERKREYRDQKREHWSFPIELSRQRQDRLKIFMNQELDYYNSLINGLDSFVRSSPENLLQVTDRYEKLGKTVSGQRKAAAGDA